VKKERLRLHCVILLDMCCIGINDSKNLVNTSVADTVKRYTELKIRYISCIGFAEQ